MATMFPSDLTLPSLNRLATSNVKCPGLGATSSRDSQGHGATAIKEGLCLLILNFQTTSCQSRGICRAWLTSASCLSWAAEEEGSKLPGHETLTQGLRTVRSHPNPHPKALSVHDYNVRAARGPTGSCAMVDSQEASVSEYFLVHLHWVDHPASMPRHGWRGAPLQGAPIAWHEVPESLETQRAWWLHIWLTIHGVQLPWMLGWCFAVTEQH